MSRSGYRDDCDDQWGLIRRRGAVASAIRGKRGQAFLREMLAALDALPEKRLIENDLEHGRTVSALGAVGKARGTPMANIDFEDQKSVAAAFSIPITLAGEIMSINDEAWNKERPEHRYIRVRKWVESKLADNPAAISEPVVDEGFGG